MTPPSLPQEIIDNIIDEFKDHTPGNKCTLASLSMVARAWRERSQEHLFSALDFRKRPSLSDLTKAELVEFGPVFSLTRDLKIHGRWNTASRFAFVTADFLPFFRNLETLSLTRWDARWLSTEQISTCFGHLGETLTHFTLEGAVSSTSLIFLTSVLPRLHALQISIITTPTDGETRKKLPKEELPTTGSFQGSLCLLGFFKNHDDFLVFLASTSPKFRSIYIENCGPGDGMEKLLNSSAATLESLGLYINENSWPNSTSLSKCTQLRKVSVFHPWSESTASLLRTIRSPYLKKFVIYSRLWSHGDPSRIAHELDAMDGELCEVYDQWAKHVTGKIEVRIDSEELGSVYLLEGFQEHLKGFFPRSTEKFAVTVGHSDRFGEVLGSKLRR